VNVDGGAGGSVVCSVKMVVAFIVDSSAVQICCCNGCCFGVQVQESMAAFSGKARWWSEVDNVVAKMMV